MAHTHLFSARIQIAALCSTSLFLILTLSSIALGQGSTPQRGFQPGASYALSDIETINTTNGNLSLHLPLGKLPAGRGGLSGQLNLHYDSKLYDSRTEWYQDVEKVEQNGEPHMVVRNMLVTSNEGGWHYGTGYELQLIDRMSQYPPEIAPQYPAPETIYHYKVKVAFPDGSVHEFMPRVGSQINQGYSDIRPDGYQSRYNGGFVEDVPYLTNNVTYYTFDGTYIRLEVQHDSDAVWGNNPWTLYFPDGMKVTNFGKRITDRNGNYVEFSDITYNSHPATQLMDQLGRKIIIEYGGVSDGEIVHVSGVGGADLTYQVHWKGIQVSKTYSTTMPEQFSPSSSQGYPGTLGSQFVVSRIDLPAPTGGLQYIFGYNAADSGSTPCCTPSYGWGELSSVTTPTGAQAQYQYQLNGQNGPGLAFTWDNVLRNYVTQKTLSYQQQYDGNSSPITETWTYDLLSTNTIVNPDGGIVRQWNEAQRNYRTEQPDGTVVEKLWQANRPQNFSSTAAYDEYTGLDPYEPQRVNGYVKTEFTSIRDASGTLVKTAIKDYNYDKNGNITRVAEYDWVDYGSVSRGGAYSLPTGIPAGAVVKRVTTNTLAYSTPDASDSSSNNANSYWNATAPGLRNAVAVTEVSNGSATLARTESTYDNPATTGNLTQQKSWDSTKGAYSNPLTSVNSISVSNQYDIYGNTTLSTDARGYQTQIVYGSVGGFTDLYPTQIKTAYQTSVQRTETREYDFYTGAVTRTTDVDNNVSMATTYDVFGRPTLVKAAEGKPEETRTSTSYSDVNRRVIVKSDLNTAGDEKLVSIQHYDQLGRVRLTRQLEDAATQSATDETTGIKVQTRYQYSGNFSYVLTSNPYRAATSVSAGSEATMGWSRSKSDNGGRVIEVQTFAGASAPDPWGTNTTSTGIVTTAYDANFTTVTDQAGKVRRSMSDGLGRLAHVDEPDANGNLGTTTAPVQPTSYDYDAFGNLITVDQGQTRRFAYSSLSRLTSASNPESGTVSYQYDNNGNLTQKTDARNIVITYQYDALNRNTTVNYSNTTIGSPDVPDIKRFYDGANNGKGRFWYSYTAGDFTVGSNVEHTAIDSYDALGRPKVQRQLFKLNGTWGPAYQTSREYNRAGGVTTQTYPSGHTVTYNYDGAGRLADKDAQNLAFTGNLGDGLPRTYSKGISYVSSGALKQEQFGTTMPVYNKLFYNSRLQLAEALTSTSGNDSSWNRGKIVNDYSLQCSGAGCNATDNNGNLRQQQLYIPGNDQVSSWTTWYQRYDYDAWNRLKRVHEYTGNTLLDWQQEYDYDRWGNRTLNASGTWIGNASNSPNPALNETAFETGSLATDNRLYAPGDLALRENQRRMRYDTAGNLTVDSYTGAGERVYDAENRMRQAWANNQWQYYTYNADGQRTRRKINNEETWQIYGFDGELLAEYAANGGTTSPQKEYGYRNGQLLVTAESGSSTPSGSPYGGTAAAIPGVIQAENYDNGGAGIAYNDTTAGTHGQDYDQPPNYPPPSFRQPTDVDIYKSAGYSNGYIVVGQAGDWTSYSVNVATSGTYTLDARVAWGGTNGAVGSFHVEVDGVDKSGAMQIPDTGWSFTTVTKTGVQLSAGPHVLRIFWDVNASNNFCGDIDYLNLTLTAAASPYGGTAAAIPGVIQAENYDNGGAGTAYQDTSPGTHGQDYDQPPNYPPPSFRQPTDVDIYKSAGYSNGYIVVGQAGDWTSYSVNVATSGTYTLDARVAWGGTNGAVGSFHVEVDGVDKSGAMQIPDTGWSFTTVTKTGVQLSAGPHVLRISWDVNASNNTCGDIDYLNLTLTAASNSSSSIHWLVTDQLGTPRLILDQTGTLANVKRHDYLPFGEEVFALGLRGLTLGYSGSDGVRQQFTAKERDTEIGLDYFGARYYSSMQGRFTSPDPLYIEMGRLGDPQQFNLYAYTRNNPLKFIDPTGLDIEVTGTEQEAYRKRLQQNVSFQTQINSQTNKVQIVDSNGNALDKKQLKELGKTLKGGEKELFKAITDTNHHVTIETTRSDANVDFGRFVGGGTNKVDAADLDLLDAPKNAGGLTSAAVVGHETLEAYAGSKGKGLDQAHKFANKFFDGLELPIPNTLQLYGNQALGIITRASAEFPVHGSTTVREKITREFLTPIPMNAIPSGHTPAHIVDVEKKP